MSRGFMFIAALLACGAQAHDTPAHSPGGPCARYVGNEGVLVSNGATRIVFDAFYSSSYGQYALVPAHIEAALVDGAAPYDDIDAVFVSHVHGDHFSPRPALRFLRAHPHVRLFGSRQTADALREAGASQAVLNRVTEFDLASGDAPATITVGDVEISVAAIPHAGGKRMADVQNLSFRVTLNDALTVVHMGDAGPDREAFARYPSHWNERSLNAAFPPYWLFASADGRGIVRDFLAADQVIGIHLPDAVAERATRIRAETGFDVFAVPGETRALGNAPCDAARPMEADAP